MTKPLSLTALGMLTAAALLSLSSAVASADIAEVSPSPEVTIDTPAHKGDNAVRAAPYGEVEAQGTVRDCKKEVVCAQGKVADTVEAKVGSKAAPFNLESNGEFTFDPPIGNWTPLAP
ncbi:hypothetical protein [Mycolicibacterium bacteremicum]|uniref:Uncharacterized protein n=1 Tax=Mycolicibacterium bacteremicum TaxID=564198 RepID=A0A1W9YSH1_MYCBA|nr:hypothetical protein [Mycolicibacterium bacteremicum]MCV7431192.1 hypothetical protein [Mycolicibacterium bacteremicum]ORA02862.1 hypothetical protein BST17_21550 [Mycolicibacterium bacteremicum]